MLLLLVTGYYWLLIPQFIVDSLLPLQMILKCCWTDVTVIIYLVLYSNL